MLLASAGVAPAVRADPVDFDRDIRPILSDNCYACHGPDAEARQAELRLDTQEGAFAERDGAPAFVPSRPVQSEALRRIFADDPDERMPPPDSKLALTGAQKRLIQKWVAEGATWTTHWAFASRGNPSPPQVGDSTWPRNDIDHFVLARLQKAGLAPSPQADRATLIRRVTLDLTGLPPTPDDVDAFLADDSPNAYEKVVDRLLKSPKYGERMAWEWLDASRYADTDGFQGDPTRTMWPWRDWLIRALNDNMPFDQFTIEMLAGDLLPDATLEQVIATGFNRNHMYNGEGGRIAEETRVENVFDRTETTSTVWLGLTMTCCRCHDHKFDPITQQEYYQLFSFFNNTSESGKRGAGKAAPTLKFFPPDKRRRHTELKRSIAELKQSMKLLGPQLDGKQAAWEVEIRKQLENDSKGEIVPPEIAGIIAIDQSKRDDKQRDALQNYFREENSDQWRKWQRDLKRFEADQSKLDKAAPLVMIMDELPSDKRRETFILSRGLYNKPLDAVASGTPSFLPPLPDDAPRDRLTLARWLVDPENPLSARVTVNRYWQTFFGTGLVSTSEDFGRQGSRPSHPMLLDWLANQFIAGGWDVKSLHKLIVTSATYQQSSRVTPELLQRDRDNRLLSRGARYRLPSWMIRDQALAASGLLSERIGGPSVKPYQPEGIWAEATFGKIKYQPDTGENLYRRSLYIFWRRIVGPTMFFDAGKRQTCEVKPTRTNTPLHALTTLNETTFVEASRALAQRVMQQVETPAERIALAFRLVATRTPTPDELSMLVERWEMVRKEFTAHPQNAEELLAVGDSPRDTELDNVDHAAYAVVCSLLLNLDEVLNRE